MDRYRRKANGAPGQVDSIPMPTGGGILLSTLPAAAVLIIGLPLFFWWRYDLLDDHRILALLLTVVYYMLVILAVGHARAPLPRPANQFSREHVGWALGTAPRTVTVPQDPDQQIAIGVAATSRVRTAALISVFALTAVTTGLVHSMSFLMVIAAVLGVLALLFIARARRSWMYLSMLHAEGQPIDRCIGVTYLPTPGATLQSPSTKDNP